MLKTPLLIAGALCFLLSTVMANGIDSLKQRLNTARQADTARIQVYLDLSGAYFEISPDSSLHYALMARQESGRIKHTRLFIAANLQTGNAYYQLSRYDSAMLYTQTALALAIKHKHPGYHTRALNATGNIYLRQQDYTPALRYYDSSKRISAKYKDSTELATAINNIAIINFEKGNYAIALKSHMQALDINEKLNRKREIETTLLNISNIYFRLNEFALAKVYAARSLKMAKTSGSKWSVVSVYTTYAMIYNEERRYDSSLAALNEAMTLAKDINSPYLTNIISANLAECHLNMGNIKEAETLYTTSLVESGRLNDQLGVALAKGGLGQILVRKGKLQQGIAYLQDALVVLQQNEMPEQAMHLADTLGHTLEKMGRYKEALVYYHIKDDYRDAIAKTQIRVAAQKMEYDYTLNKKEAQIELLEKDRTIRDGKIVNNRIILISAMAAALLAIIIAILLFRNMMSTKRRNAVIMQQKHEMELQAQKLEQLNTFKDTTFSVLSHDLRSPINALTGTMSMLDEGVITPEEFKLYKDELSNKLQSVTLLLDNLLQWAKSHMKGEHTLDIEKLSVRRKTLRSFAVLKDAAAQKNITLDTNIPEDLYVLADRHQLEMVMRNLLSNAIKFTPHNGTVSVNAAKQDDKVAISVTDNGVGMTPEQAAQLFDGSANTSTYGTGGEKGTGLGLQLSYNFIVNNKGNITVDSHPGQGTTFTILLPKA